jgi:dTDP-4-amino-4,6-dideoxygalactose transaminase
MDKNQEYLGSKIRLNVPHLTSKEMDYINHACRIGQLSGDGYYTKECHKWLESKFDSKKALLTHSCTGALEMSAILMKVSPKDEIIIPSYTFVSTANAFVLRGAVPVFVDIRDDTLNINEKLIENAITRKTKGIVAVHYAGVACEMDIINKIAKKHNLIVIEDAAQGFMSLYKNKFLGTLGDMGAFSFHETKNIISGEGGALSINDTKYIERAEIIREKGTNRNKFIRGQVDKYTWVDMGSSYLPGEIVAAFLLAQFENADEITKKRISIWNMYHEQLKSLEDQGLIKRPSIPDSCSHNGHLYYIIVSGKKLRDMLIAFLNRRGVLSAFHYVPLHNSPAGKKYGKYIGDMKVTNNTWNGLIRLPLYYDLKRRELEYVVELIYQFFNK